MSMIDRGVLQVKRFLRMILVGGLFALATTVGAAAQQVQTLRGSDASDASVASEHHGVVQVKKWGRSFMQQPPLIPHKIEDYEVDLKVNQCLRCHDWRFAAKENAPQIAKSHYVDRDGHEWSDVVRGRWFCTQCHVPQTDAQPLVENVFQATASQ